MAIYKHQCGQRYVRTTRDTPPAYYLMVCERCLEPMPLCDDDRAAFVYEAITDMSFRRLMEPALSASFPSTKRPVLRTAIGRSLAHS
jgi:hypothetical protein